MNAGVSTEVLMKDIDPAKLRYLEAKAREIGKLIDDAINESITGGQSNKKFGFALLLFSFDGSELTWISNAEREDMTKALEELLSNWKRGKMTDFPGGIDARN